jgi:hypothetical protein
MPFCVVELASSIQGAGSRQPEVAGGVFSNCGQFDAIHRRLCRCSRSAVSCRPHSDIAGLGLQQREHEHMNEFVDQWHAAMHGLLCWSAAAQRSSELVFVPAELVASHWSLLLAALSQFSFWHDSTPYDFSIGILT